MAPKTESLKPYKSLLVCELPVTPRPRLTVTEVMAAIEKIVRETGGREIIGGPSGSQEVRQLWVAHTHYVERKRASWTTDPEIIDTMNHLVILCASARFLALILTDPAILDRVNRRIGRDTTTRLGDLSVVRPGILNAALVRGETQTLWLSGAHRRVASKVDNKVIYGMDIRLALDPLSDQTYYFTAARTKLAEPGLYAAVGVTPQKARVWAGPTRDWDDFTSTVSTILEVLEKTGKAERAPFPILAIPTVEKADLRGISGAYDAVLAPPELVDPEIAKDERQELERWTRLSFQVTPTSGADFEAAVIDSGADGSTREVARIRFTFDLKIPAKPRWEPLTQGACENESEAAELMRKLKTKREWLKVWYDSGHTLTDGGFVTLRYRDLPFQDFLWKDFGSYNVGQEKPSPLSLATVGEQGSLFCWVKNIWKHPDRGKNRRESYLACDDGAGEIADFIHLDLAASPPMVTLIHVKASKSTDCDRPISVSDYEIVTGQAVKNLRFLDSLVLDKGLVDGLGKRIGELAWKGGRTSTRAAFITALKKVASNYDRTVVILQPRVTKRALDEARKKPNAPMGKRLRQLDTLLLGARANCQAFGARLFVVGER